MEKDFVVLKCPIQKCVTCPEDKFYKMHRFESIKIFRDQGAPAKIEIPMCPECTSYFLDYYKNTTPIFVGKDWWEATDSWFL